MKVTGRDLKPTETILKEHPKGSTCPSREDLRHEVTASMRTPRTRVKRSLFSLRQYIHESRNLRARIENSNKAITHPNAVRGASHFGDDRRPEILLTD